MASPQPSLEAQIARPAEDELAAGMTTPATDAEMASSMSKSEDASSPPNRPNQPKMTARAIGKRRRRNEGRAVRKSLQGQHLFIHLVLSSLFAPASFSAQRPTPRRTQGILTINHADINSGTRSARQRRDIFNYQQKQNRAWLQQQVQLPSRGGVPRHAEVELQAFFSKGRCLLQGRSIHASLEFTCRDKLGP